MRHAVLGAGNLGLDLGQELHQREHTVKIFSSCNGFNYPLSAVSSVTLDMIYDFRPDHVWVTIGAGSVAEAKKDYMTFSDLHVRLVMELAQKLPQYVNLHIFSTDYVANETLPNDPNFSVEIPLSLYALSKLHMEQLIHMLDRPNTIIYRVGSLYGFHKQHKCFPYKVRRKYLGHLVKGPDDKPVQKMYKLEMPINRVTPTPTTWLGKTLATYHEHIRSDSPVTVHMAPLGNTPIHEWGQLILGDHYEVLPGDVDKERPLASQLECSLNIEVPDWRTLWDLESEKWDNIPLSKTSSGKVVYG